MDRICCCVMEKISSLAPLGRYTVVSADELFESFPEDAEKSYSELKKALKTLGQDGYLDLKYQDGEFFCAAPLKKFVKPEPIVETALPPSPPERKKPRIDARVLAAFAGGLVGSAVGSAVISVIFSLV